MLYYRVRLLLIGGIITIAVLGTIFLQAPEPTLTVDELLGGSLLIRDDDTYGVIGHFSALHETHPTLKRYVMLINQAIALRDAVHGDDDLIETAREREQSESGLLERSWLEGQESIEIEPEGLLHKLRRE